MTSAEQVVQRQVEAYNARDLDAFLACYAEDIEIFDLPNREPSMSGKEMLVGPYQKLFDQNPELNAEIKSRRVFDSFVVDEEFVTGAAKYPDGLRACAIYQVVNDKIRSVWFCP